MRLFAAIFVAATMIGCGARSSGPGSMDAGGRSDGGPEAGNTDAGNIDAGNTDTGNMDAGSSPDAGGNRDAGSADTGNTDAGNTADQGAPPVADAASERAGMDAGGADGGPFACGTLTCAGDEYCVPEIWGTCHAPADGGACLSGQGVCDRGGGQMGCRAPCYQQRCSKTIPFGCNVTTIPAPRWLYCTCE